MKRASPSSRIGRRLSCRPVGGTSPAGYMDSNEPAVAKNCTAQQCGRPASDDTGPTAAQLHTSNLRAYLAASLLVQLEAC